MTSHVALPALPTIRLRLQICALRTSRRQARSEAGNNRILSLNMAAAGRLSRTAHGKNGVRLVSSRALNKHATIFLDHCSRCSLRPEQPFWNCLPCIKEPPCEMWGD